MKDKELNQRQKDYLARWTRHQVRGALPFDLHRCERNNDNGDTKWTRRVIKQQKWSARYRERWQILKREKQQAIEELIAKGELPGDYRDTFIRQS